MRERERDRKNINVYREDLIGSIKIGFKSKRVITLLCLVCSLTGPKEGGEKGVSIELILVKV